MTVVASHSGDSLKGVPHLALLHFNYTRERETSLIIIIIMEERKENRGGCIPFIRVMDDGTFEITNEAMLWLQEIGGDKKVSVTTVVGPWRSGKSFLASLLCNK